MMGAPGSSNDAAQRARFIFAEKPIDSPNRFDLKSRIEVAPGRLLPQDDRRR
ncbi:hypothetical protein [Burkholderia ubonensis]|uniref:hypothetical protein n=1 Tax=Burkholderia ubonensis TaxID=101571 RepID=UPI0012F8F37E|nr:hypothetical protein [Burkholderia ubonensis]